MMTSDDLLEAFKEMTLMELSAFMKQFEETFGVTATAPVVLPPGPQPAATEPEPDEQDEFDVILEKIGDAKIQVIKAVRPLTQLGLKDAKDLVDSAPVTVLTAVSREQAFAAQAALEAAGATIALK